jgi:hypothetical protein
LLHDPWQQAQQECLHQSVSHEGMGGRSELAALLADSSFEPMEQHGLDGEPREQRAAERKLARKRSASGPVQNEELEVFADDTWGLMVTPAGGAVRLHLY